MGWPALFWKKHQMRLFKNLLLCHFWRNIITFHLDLFHQYIHLKFCHCTSKGIYIQHFYLDCHWLLGIFDLKWIVFCCYNCLDLPWEKFFQVWVTFFPSSWEQEYCVEKRLCKFETVGREFVTFSRHYSCLRELGKQVTNTWKKLWAWYKSRQL